MVDPRPSRPPHPSRLGAALNTLTRVLALVALLIAVPYVLISRVGWPLPTTLPAASEVYDAIRAGDYDPRLLIKVIAVIVWLVWSMTMASVLVQAFGQIRQVDIACPRFMSRRLWSLTGRWVSGVTVAASALVVNPHIVSAAPLATITQQQPLRLTATPTSPTTSTRPVLDTTVATPRFSVQRFVTPRDMALYEVAETLWGTKAAIRYPELLTANQGIVDPDELVAAGTSLTVPAETAAADWRSVQAGVGDTYLSIATDIGHPDLRASLYDVNHDRIGRTIDPGETVNVPVNPDTLPGTVEHVVVHGDTEWDIVEDNYGTVTWPMIHGLHEANRGVTDTNHRHRLYDENLIHPGQSLELPATLDGHTLHPAPNVAPAPATNPAETTSNANAASSDRAGDTGSDLTSTPATAAVAATPASSTPATPPTTSATTTASAPRRDGGVEVVPASTVVARGGVNTGTGTGTTQRATNDVVAEPDILDTDHASTLGPKIAMATLGLGVLGGIWELRRRRRRRSKPSPTPNPSLDDTEALLADTASLSRLRTARSVLPMLLDELVDDTALIMAICVTETDVVVHLDEELAPLGPFTGDPGRWQIPIADITDNDTVHQMLPTLVSLGYSTEHGEVFTDIESLGCVEVDGPAAEDLVRSIATQLGTRTDTVLELHTTLDVPDTVTGGAVVHLDTLDTNAARLVVSGSAQVRTVLATNGLATSAQARHADIYGPLPAVVVAVTGTQPDDALAVLTRCAGGGSGLGIIATQHLTNAAVHITTNTTTTDTAATATMVTDDGLNITIDYPSLLPASTATAIAALIAHTHDNADTPAPRHRIDALASIGLADPDETLPPITTQDRDSDVVSIAVDPYVEADYKWRIAVLGRPTLYDEHDKPVSFTEGQPNRNGARGAELVAYLAHRPGRSATVAEVAQALWHNHPLPKTGTVDQLIVRTRLVTQGAVERNGDQVVLADNVISDTTLFTDRYTHAASNPNHEQARETLHDALATITGSPFAQTRIYEWAVDHRIVDDIDAKVALAIGAYVEWSLELGDYQAAAWGVEQALRSNPVDEWVTRIGMRVDAAAGNKNGLKRRYDSFIEALARQELEPEEETVALYHQLTGRPQTAAV